MRVHDPCELEIPSVGMVRLEDAETGEIITVDTSGRLQAKYAGSARKIRRNSAKDYGEEVSTILNLRPIPIRRHPAGIFPHAGSSKKPMNWNNPFQLQGEVSWLDPAIQKDQPIPYSSRLPK